MDSIRQRSSRRMYSFSCLRSTRNYLRNWNGSTMSTRPPVISATKRKAKWTSQTATPHRKDICCYLFRYSPYGSLRLPWLLQRWKQSADAQTMPLQDRSAGHPAVCQLLCLLHHLCTVKSLILQHLRPFLQQPLALDLNRAGSFVMIHAIQHDFIPPQNHRL